MRVIDGCRLDHIVEKWLERVLFIRSLFNRDTASFVTILLLEILRGKELRRLDRGYLPRPGFTRGS